MSQKSQVTSKDENAGRGGSGGGPSPGGRRTALLVGGVTLLAIVAIAAFAVMSAGGGGEEGEAASFTPNDEGLLPVGSQAPGFSAETVDGGSVALGDGGATMLVFFATWCPHCQDEAPIIGELEGEYGDDLRVIMAGIDGEDDPAKVREFVESYEIEGPAIYDPSLGQTYQVTGYPTVYVLNGDGKMVAAHSGEAPKEVLRSWVEEAL